MAETRILIVFVLVFMVAAVGCAAEKLHDRGDEFKEWWEIEDDDDGVELLDLPSLTNGRGNKILVNVDSFGAVGDGVSDDTKVTIHLKYGPGLCRCMDAGVFCRKISPPGSVKAQLPCQCHTIQRSLCKELDSPGCTQNPPVSFSPHYPVIKCHLV